MRGETKFVTVLATELCGRQELLAAMDPDEADAAIRALFRELGAVATANGAQVGQGHSGLLAVFGFDRTTESDAFHAVATAMAMHAVADGFSLSLEELTGVPFGIGVGVHTGRIAATPSLESGRFQGPAAAQAEQLCAQASTGATLVSDEAFQAARDRYEFRLHGDPRVPRSQRVYRLVGARTRSHYGFRIEEPLVGRSTELDRIESSLGQLEGSRARLLVVQGLPGIGKTRLCREIIKRFAAKGGRVIDCTQVDVPGVSALLGTVRSLLGETPGRGPIQAALAAAGFDDAPAEADLLAGFLDLGASRDTHESRDREGRAREGEQPASPPLTMEPMLRRERAFAILARWVVAACRHRPGLLVAGDARGADESFQAWLQYLLERQPAREKAASPLAILAECRPDRPWDFRDVPGREHAAIIEIGPLPRTEGVALVAQTLGLPGDQAQWPAGLADFALPLVERAGGNPLFIEGLVRTVEVEGAWTRDPAGKPHFARILTSVELPATLGLLVAARLDALPDRLRQVVDVAAVLGRRFEASLLGAVALVEDLDQVVEALVQAGILVTEGAGMLAFSQQSILEVAAETQLPERLKTLHAQAAIALERLAEQVGFDASERLASHFMAAGKRPRAVRHLVAAGVAARRASRNAAARELLRSALEISRSDAPAGVDVGRILEALADVEGTLGNKEAAVMCWRELAASGDPCLQVRALCELGRYHENPLSDFPAAQAFLEQGLALARASGNAAGEADILVGFATVALRMGSFREAVHLCDHVLARPTGSPIAGEGDLRAVKGAALMRLKDFDGAIAELRRSLEIRLAARNEAAMLVSLDALRDSDLRDARLDDAILRGVNTLGASYLEAGLLQEAEATLRRALDFARRVPVIDRKAMILNNLGDLHMRRKQYDLAIRHFEDVASAYRQSGNRRGECIALANLGEACTKREEASRALESLNLACDRAETLGYRELLPAMLRLLADAQDLAGQSARATATRFRAGQLEAELAS